VTDPPFLNLAGDVGCANTPSVNSGNAYIFICNGEEFVLFADCASEFGCKTEGPKFLTFEQRQVGGYFL
jgi:hypothetical protein